MSWISALIYTVVRQDNRLYAQKTYFLHNAVHVRCPMGFKLGTMCQIQRKSGGAVIGVEFSRSEVAHAAVYRTSYH